MVMTRSAKYLFDNMVAEMGSPGGRECICKMFTDTFHERGDESTQGFTCIIC